MIEDIAFDWMPSIIENFVILYFMSYYLGFKDHVALRNRKSSIWIFTVLLCLSSYMSTEFPTVEILFIVAAILVCICFGFLFLKGSLINTILLH